MTSTNINIGFSDQRNSSKVLKPPGGGSSDIFGATNGSSSAASTPRSVSKNHMVSNIFGAPQNRNGDVRRNTTADSHNRLFGEVEQRHQQAPVRSHSKSNIPFGGGAGDATDAPMVAANGNGKSSSVSNGNGVASIVHAENGNSGHHQANGNGNGLNGKSSSSSSSNGNSISNGNGNGGGRTNGAAAGGGDGHLNGNGTKHEQPEHAQSPRTTNALLVGSPPSSPMSTTSSYASASSARHIHMRSPPPPQQAPLATHSPRFVVGGRHSQHQLLLLQPQHQPAQHNVVHLIETHGAPLTTHSNTSSTTTNADSQQSRSRSSASTSATTSSTSSSSLSLDAGYVSPRRNPVTGFGIDEPARRPRKMDANREAGGNPVTGVGYRGAADNHSSAPTLNGSKQVINKNRIPPGGFSSGLW